MTLNAPRRKYKRHDMNVSRISIIATKPTFPMGSRRDFDLMPSFGPLLISTILKNDGYEVKFFDEAIEPLDWDYIFSSDAVGFFVMSIMVRPTMKYCARIKTNNPQTPIFVGGTHPSELPEDTLRYADYVVRMEGDETVPDLLDALETGRDLGTVAGLSYRRNGKIIHNPNRPFVKDIDIIPEMSLIHGFEDEARRKRRLKADKVINLIQASRGCPFTCAFCYGIRQLGVGYRTRSIDSLIEEIKYRMDFSNSKRFMFVDNHFSANPKFTRAVLTRMKDEGIHFSWCLVFVRIEIYKHEDILQLMKEVGITDLFIGLESFNDSTLSAFNKQQSREQMIEALGVIREYNLHITGGFLYGADTDTLETSREILETALIYGVDYLSTLSLMEFPNISGTGMVPYNRMIIRDFDYCSAYFVSHFPKYMRPSVLQREMLRTLFRFYAQQLWKNVVRLDLQELFYKVRGYPIARQAIKQWKAHATYLETIERGFYDVQDHLIEEKLGEGIFPPDFVRAWTPEFQANVVHRGPAKIPTGQIRVTDGYGEKHAHPTGD